MAFDRQKFHDSCQQYPPLSLYDYPCLDSTNQRCWELCDRGVQTPFAVIAREQTAGRGQWGRTWQSPPGGLYLSLALAPHLPARNAPHLTLCSAWGIASALRDGDLPISLKWPNDLILEGKKLGGIKSETRIRQQQIARAVVGVGINWDNPVPDGGINLRSRSQIASLEMLAAIAVCGILSGYQRYLAEGIETILPAYWELICHQNRPISVDGCSGVIVGIAPTGALKIHLQKDNTTIPIERMPGTISLGYDD